MKKYAKPVISVVELTSAERISDCGRVNWNAGGAGRAITCDNPTGS